MADITDVQDALADLVTAAIYPTETSAVGFPVKIYAGWPDPGTLDADMVVADGLPTAGHVSIFVPPGAERNTSRFSTEWFEQGREIATYALGVAGQTITVSGVAPSSYRPQNLAVSLDAAAYTFQTTAGQTSAQVAEALLTIIQAGYTASRSGSVITVDNARIGEARVGATGVISRELRRQEVMVQVSIWAPTPDSRTAISRVVDVALAQVERFTLPDGYAARLIYKGSRQDDFTQKQSIYRRTLSYTVEYATTQTDTATEITVSVANYADEFGNPISSVEA